MKSKERPKERVILMNPSQLGFDTEESRKRVSLAGLALATDEELQAHGATMITILSTDTSRAPQPPTNKRMQTAKILWSFVSSATPCKLKKWLILQKRSG